MEPNWHAKFHLPHGGKKRNKQKKKKELIAFQFKGGQRNNSEYGNEQSYCKHIQPSKGRTYYVNKETKAITKPKLIEGAKNKEMRKIFYLAQQR